MEKIDKDGKVRIYVLNLDRSPERLQTFMRSFEPLGLDVVRVPAVDGK
jgi:glycosyl transferase family 25